MKEIDRFDLEQKIQSCWNVTSDLGTVLSITESEDMDRIQNAIIGLRELYDQKFDDLWACFEKLIDDGKIV